MFDFLVNHARKNVWCTPSQDLQAIFKPGRLSPPGGVLVSAPLQWGRVALPTTKDKYHLFQIGQLNPALMGLMPYKHVWHSLARMAEKQNLFADVYLDNGLQLPKSESYLLTTENRDVILAVREQPSIADIRNVPIYFRFYSNAYFSSLRSASTDNAVTVKFIRHQTVEATLLFQNTFNQLLLKEGAVWCFVNGVYTQGFLPQALTVGDTIEVVYDSTVKQVVDLDIRDLKTFDSDLDQKRKYLLHYAGPQAGGDQTIDYRDDIDVYLIQKTGTPTKPKWNGRYFHKNSNDAFRQVTHRDYAITVPYISTYVTDNPAWTDSKDLTVRLFIRHAGYDRPLVYEHNRIFELYKLPDEDLTKAMLGIDSTVSVWRAPALENSDYVKVMDARYGQIQRHLVQGAYGYNAIAKLEADSPIPVETVNGRQQISLPYGLQVRATMYEYDANGLLLGYYPYAYGAEYTPVNPTCALVEGISGRGSFTVPVAYGQVSQDYDATYDWRYYIAKRTSNGIDQTSWQDVTGQDDKYQIINGKIHWLVDPEIWAFATKNDKDFLAYDLTLSPENGLLRFSIDENATYPNVSAHGVSYIPVGKLDLWLNNHALIENLDYYVKWPQVVIVNKKYLVEGNAQKITVRGTGFCNADMTRTLAGDHGFVEYGLLSHNNRFDIRDDKVIRIVVDGKTYERSVLKFSESDSGLYMDNVPNGSPYVIEDIVVPLRDTITPDTTTYELLTQAQAVDKEIEDYLTLKLPEPTPANPDQIENLYPVYSPFASTVMYDMINGDLTLEDFQGQYSDRDVKQALAQYVYLLAYDPTQKPVDLNHVAIHPHNKNVVMTLNIYQYNFLSRAIHVFLKDKVDISRFIKLQDNWIDDTPPPA